MEIDNRILIPREISKWLQSLDLSFKIKNIRRDLSNGFLIAEILSRYPIPCRMDSQYKLDDYYKVNMKQFSIGNSLEERTANWAFLKKILRKYYQMPFNDDIIMQVIHQAPNKAFDVLCLLFKLLTKREPFILRKVNEADKFKQYAEVGSMPKFMRPIASQLLRDTEIQRIPDNLTRLSKIDELLKNHREYLRIERINFIKSKQFYKMKKLRQMKIKAEGSKYNDNSGGSNISASNEIIQGNKNKSLDLNEDLNNENALAERNEKKEEKVNLMAMLKDSVKNMNETYNAETEFKTLIKKNFIDTDYNIQLELKNYSDENEILEFFFEKIQLCTEDKMKKIFVAYDEKEKDFFQIISRTLLEIVPYVKIICKFFDVFFKNGIPWEKFKNTTIQICKSLKEFDMYKCDNIFINYALDEVLDMIKLNPLYRNEMCQLIFSLACNNSESHYNILEHVRKKFASRDELLYYHILVQCMNNLHEEEDILNEDIVYFYNEAVLRGISNQCDLIKIKSIYIINQFMRFDYSHCLQYHHLIFKHISTWNWEILSLILIYCAKMLSMYNHEKIHKKQLGDTMQRQDKDDTEKEKEKDKDKDKDKEKDNSNEEKKEIAEMNRRLEEFQKNEAKFLEIIDIIFNWKSPRMTIKIGFIYLAGILEFYPDLAKKYMKILIEYKDNTVRTDVLNVEESDVEYEYTIHCYTERYKICGAPYFWNQIAIAGIFRDYVIEKLERLETTHLLILHSIIIHQDFNEEESEAWIKFYNDLKKYFFVALCEKKYSNIALSICNKIFSFEKILGNLLESTFDLFISTMKIIYQTDINEESHANMKTLLTFISEIKTNNCKQYVYNLIKTFAIQNNKIYLKSNLLDLMNKIYNEQRGEIFNE